jgi:hypothetical protein
MKTAVEWLQSQIVFESVDKELLARWDEDSDLSEYFEQALQMEKEQMLKTFTQSRAISVECAVWNCQGNERKWESFEQYYNETFKQQEQ